jgi:hypothetical protein
MKRFLWLAGVVASVGLVDAECNFRSERTLGKAEVLKVVGFNAPRRNKCFQERGQKWGKILIRYEPEGTFDVYEFTAYFDPKTLCFDKDKRQIDCSDVPAGSEIKDVGFIQRGNEERDKLTGRGILTRLSLVP